MFPLGTVLFPFAQLPLHVFEPRYRTMTQDVLQGGGEFGVVLIERGREVGGGDLRFAVGTVARVVQAARIPDGRWMLATVGERRLRVTEWLDDDPYPRAHVSLLEENAPDGDERERIQKVERALRRVHAMRAELGARVSVDVALSDDPVRASFEAAALAGLSPLDAYGLLDLDDATRRLDQLAYLLDEEATLLDFRLTQ
jgi:Lon protease-like protein